MRKIFVDFHWEQFKLGHFSRTSLPHRVSGMSNGGAVVWPLYNDAINNSTATPHVVESKQVNRVEKEISEEQKEENEA